MTLEQRNDLCLEWESISATIRRQLLEEYQAEHDADLQWEQWEEFMVQRLQLKQFWRTVGLL